MSKKFDSTLSQLADLIAREAMAADLDLETRVDAFKALTAYSLGNAKVKKPEDDKDAANFSKFHDKIRAVS